MIDPAFEPEGDLVAQRMRATLVEVCIPGGGPISFGRGVEIELSMNDRAFDGGSPFMLAAVLEHFLAAESVKWPTRFGRRPRF